MKKMETNNICLVLNLQDDEPFVVNICTTYRKAEELLEQYRNNAKKAGSNMRFEIEVVDLYKEVAWDCYNNEYYHE